MDPQLAGGLILGSRVRYDPASDGSAASDLQRRSESELGKAIPTDAEKIWPGCEGPIGTDGARTEIPLWRPTSAERSLAKCSIVLLPVSA